MRGNSIWRWNAVGRVSAAVAGVCLTGSVASAWTTTRATEFETEFEAGKGLEAGATTPAFEAVVSTAEAHALAGQAAATAAEQTLVGYLDEIAARDGAEGEKASENVQDKAAAAPEVASKDAEEATEAIASVGASAKDDNPDWDLEEPAVEAAIADADAATDRDVEEPAAETAQVDPDWDLAENPIAQSSEAESGVSDSPDPESAVAESPAAEDSAVATAEASTEDSDWDLEEPAGAQAVTAGAGEPAEASSEAGAPQNPDWDLDEPSVASAPADEVTKVNAADDELNLFP